MSLIIITDSKSHCQISNAWGAFYCVLRSTKSKVLKDTRQLHRGLLIEIQCLTCGPHIEVGHVVLKHPHISSLLSLSRPPTDDKQKQHVHMNRECLPIFHFDIFAVLLKLYCFSKENKFKTEGHSLTEWIV